MMLNQTLVPTTALSARSFRAGADLSSRSLEAKANGVVPSSLCSDAMNRSVIPVHYERKWWLSCFSRQPIAL